MGNRVSLENELINLRLTSKQQQRSAQKCQKLEAAAKAKLREAIKAGNLEGARIYGQNAIREKNNALNCLRLSSRIDAVASRLETAIRMKQVRGAFGTSWVDLWCAPDSRVSTRLRDAKLRDLVESNLHPHLVDITRFSFTCILQHWL